jgi:hypothetical protein
MPKDLKVKVTLVADTSAATKNLDAAAKATDSAAKSLDNLGPSAKKADKSLDTLGPSAKKADKSLDTLGSSAKKVGRDLDTLGPSAKKADKSLDTLGSSAKKVGRDLDTLGPSAKKADKSLDTLGSSAKKVGRDLDNARSAIDSARGSLDNIAPAALGAQSSLRDTKKATDSAGGGFGGLSASTAKAEGSFRKFGKFLKSRFVFTLSDVERAIRKVFDAMRESVTLKRQEIALRGQLASMGVSFDKFIAKLVETSNKTVTTAKLIEQSSRALLLGIPVDQIGDLLSVAASRAAPFGRSVEQAFDDLVRGIGRASPKILDNLGFVVDLEETYLSAAEALNKTVESLSRVERQAALTNLIIRSGKDAMKALGDAADDMGTSVDQAATAMADFSAAGSSALGIVGLSLATTIAGISGGIAILTSGVAGIVALLAQLIAFIPGVSSEVQKFADKALEVTNKLFESGKRGGELATGLEAANRILIRSLLGLEVASDEVNDATKELLRTQREEKLALEAAKVEARELAVQLQKTADAENELAIAVNNTAQALGLATSTDIQDQMGQIVLAIAAMKAELGASSEEFKTFSAVGNAELLVLEAQLINVQAGLGGLDDAAATAAEGMTGTAARAQALIDVNTGLITTTGDLTSGLDGVGDSAFGAGDGFGRLGTDINRAGVEADRTKSKLLQLGGTLDQVNAKSRQFGRGGRLSSSPSDPLFNNLESNGLGAFNSRGNGTRTFVIPSRNPNRVGN